MIAARMQWVNVLIAFLIAAGLGIALPAAAQDFTVHDGWLLEPVPGTFYENGIGAPTVAYDPGADEWVMYFETRFPEEAKPGCPSEWGIGRATSPDGLSWTVDPDPIIEPVDDSYYGCVVAHPVTIFDGQTWHLWFKAQQEDDACDDTAVIPPWGCDRVTGVGYATSSDGIDFILEPEPVVNVSTFGFPTVARIDGVFHLFLAYSDQANSIYEMWQSTSVDGGLSWSAPTFVLGPGTALWFEDEVYNPSLVCEDTGLYPYTLFFGGRDTEAGSLVTAGFGRAFSANSVDWFLSANNPFFEWEAVVDKDWRHWDAMRIDDDYLVFFSQKNDEEKNRVGVAYSYVGQQTSFDEAGISNRICGDDPGGPGDTDSDEDTDLDTDSDPDTDTDTVPDTDGPVTDDPGSTDGVISGGCGCQSRSNPGGCATVPPLMIPMAWVLAAVALRRRRDGSGS